MKRKFNNLITDINIIKSINKTNHNKIMNTINFEHLLNDSFTDSTHNSDETNREEDFLPPQL